jgi:hypothetical protein
LIVNGAQLLDTICHISNRFDKFVRLGGGNPGYLKSTVVISKIFQQFGDHIRAAHGFIITIQVMTFTEVSAKYHDAVGTLAEGIHYMLGVNHSRAHYTDNPHVMRILHPRRAGQISGGIGAPVAAECNDFRLKTHLIYSL